MTPRSIGSAGHLVILHRNNESAGPQRAAANADDGGMRAHLCKS